MGRPLGTSCPVDDECPYRARKAETLVLHLRRVHGYCISEAILCAHELFGADSLPDETAAAVLHTASDMVRDGPDWDDEYDAPRCGDHFII